MNIKHERTDTYNVTLYGYCGMNIPLVEGGTKDEAKEAILKRFRVAKKNGQPVVRIGKGEWEIQTPEDAEMVSDYEGILRVRPNSRRYRRILGRKIYLS